MLMLESLSRQADKSVILTRQQSLESQQFVGAACAECRVFSNGRVLPYKLFNGRVLCIVCSHCMTVWLFSVILFLLRSVLFKQSFCFRVTESELCKFLQQG